MTNPTKTSMDGAIHWAPPDGAEQDVRQREQREKEADEQVRSEIGAGTEGTHRNIESLLQTAA